MARLKSLYNDKLKQQIKEELGLENVMQVPKKSPKITLNMGVGGAAQDKKNYLKVLLADMTAIAGQKPVVTKARKSVAGFKIREEWPIGCKVTLRVASKCMNSQIAWLPSQSRVSVTSVVFLKHLMVVVTHSLGTKSRSFS